MFRFVHTGDLHVGMPAVGLGEAGKRVRAARLDSLVRILDIANEQDADAILVAGDVFDDNQVDVALVEKVAGLLNDKTRIPSFIIPGNHDPFTRDSVYRRPIWGQLRGHIHMLTSPEPVEMADGATLYPCPLTRKHGFEDPTAWIPARNTEAIRIGLAHGSMPIRPGVGDDDHPIALDAVKRLGLDYLALGHWHSQMSHPFGQADAHTWYCGAHEVTKFGETGAGNVLCVTIKSPTAPPKVESLRCGVLKWLDHPINLDENPLDEAVRSLREMPDADTTLLRIELSGRAVSDIGLTVDDLVAAVRERFVACQVDDSNVVPASVDDSLGKLLASPYLKETADELETAAAGHPTDDGPIDPVVARRALQALQEIAWQHRGK